MTDVAGTVYEPTTVIAPEQLTVADSSRIDSYCLVNATGGVTLRGESVIHAGTHVVGHDELDMGPRSAVAYNCVLLTSSADISRPVSSVVDADERASVDGGIRLARETVVMSGAVVTPSVTLHEGAVVAANTYVDEDVPEWTVRLPNGETRPREFNYE